jgi:hypothetical protein
MKKAFLGVMMVFTIVTTTRAQLVDSISYRGLVMVLHCHKVMNIACREQKAGYIDSNQVKATHISKYVARTEFHAKSAYEKYTEILNDQRVKKAADVSVSVSYGPASGSANASYETEYINKVTTTIRNSGENVQDQIEENMQEFRIEYQPHKAIQLYETVVSIPGEYERIFASPKIADAMLILPYEIVVDYSNPVRSLYKIIKECNVGSDTGEWSLFNQIADQAFNSFNMGKDAVLSNFLNRLKNELWVSSSDQYSWTVVKGAANAAVGQRQPVNQFLFFCSQLGKIEHPSHNDWAWARIVSYANNFNN